jgi:hypothetical protein
MALALFVAAGSVGLVIGFVVHILRLSPDA